MNYSCQINKLERKITGRSLGETFEGLINRGMLLIHIGDNQCFIVNGHELCLIKLEFARKLWHLNFYCSLCNVITLWLITFIGQVNYLVSLIIFGHLQKIVVLEFKWSLDYV